METTDKTNIMNTPILIPGKLYQTQCVLYTEKLLVIPKNSIFMYIKQITRTNQTYRDVCLSILYYNNLYNLLFTTLSFTKQNECFKLI